ncbi:hypothetical protein ACFZDG_03120 [Kitasatospora xanthocidica]|uniref:hypothetical protein n=1 Tax=Kitasatospora xanthocidica TaxID=83382 RepID=UPI0036EFC7D1
MLGPDGGMVEILVYVSRPEVTSNALGSAVHLDEGIRPITFRRMAPPARQARRSCAEPPDGLAFTDGIERSPDTTFGNVEADVLARSVPGFERGDFVEVIRGSAWSE